MEKFIIDAVNFHFQAQLFLLLFKMICSRREPTYLKYVLEKKFKKYGFDFDNKAGKEKIQNIEILIPIDKEGSLWEPTKKNRGKISKIGRN